MARHEHWPKLWLYGISKKWLPQAPAILEPNLDDFVEHTKETASAANAARNLSSSLEEAKLQLESSEQQKLLLRERGLTAEASNGFCLSFWIVGTTTGEWHQRTADTRWVHHSKGQRWSKNSYRDQDMPKWESSLNKPWPPGHMGWMKDIGAVDWQPTLQFGQKPPRPESNKCRVVFFSFLNWGWIKI